MIAPPETSDAVVALVHETYRRMSTPGSNPGALMGHPDFVVAGSGLGELADGSEAARGMADAVSSWTFIWSVDRGLSGRRGMSPRRRSWAR
jgi:hypothetical protein